MNEPQRTRVFCSLRQHCTWDGRTHYEMIDRPIPPLLPRLVALEEEVEKLRRDMSDRFDKEIVA